MVFGGKTIAKFYYASICIRYKQLKKYFHTAVIYTNAFHEGVFSMECL